jgi:hypothetical protein
MRLAAGSRAAGSIGLRAGVRRTAPPGSVALHVRDAVTIVAGGSTRLRAVRATAIARHQQTGICRAPVLAVRSAIVVGVRVRDSAAANAGGAADDLGGEVRRAARRSALGRCGRLAELSAESLEAPVARNEGFELHRSAAVTTTPAVGRETTLYVGATGGMFSLTKTARSAGGSWPRVSRSLARGEGPFSIPA